jgi:hypothetical protein
MALCILQTLLAQESNTNIPDTIEADEHQYDHPIKPRPFKLTRTLESLAVERADRLIVCLGIGEPPPAPPLRAE